MTSPRIIPRTSFREGRWRNGQGVSWDIASAGAEPEFTWRFALARIDGDVPFSHYPGIDRIFTLVEGGGLDLEVSGIGTLGVTERFVPTFFPGDADCACRLHHGPCTALNLFLQRSRCKAEVIIHQSADEIAVGHDGASLLFVLQGSVLLPNGSLQAGDAAQLDAEARFTPQGEAMVYEARLLP